MTSNETEKENEFSSRKENKLTMSANFTQNLRGISVDINKKIPKPMTSLTFNKLVAQTNNYNDIQNRNLQSISIQKAAEKVHSLSPTRKGDQVENYLIPPQAKDKLGKKTLILDLDETLIHSGFQPFECGVDIVLKVIKVFYKD